MLRETFSVGVFLKTVKFALCDFIYGMVARTRGIGRKAWKYQSAEGKEKTFGNFLLMFVRKKNKNGIFFTACTIKFEEKN